MAIILLLYMVCAAAVALAYKENLHWYALLAGILWLPTAFVGAIVLPVYIVIYTLRGKKT